MDPEKTPYSQSNPEQNAGGIATPDIKVYCKAQGKKKKRRNKTKEKSGIGTKPKCKNIQTDET